MPSRLLTSRASASSLVCCAGFLIWIPRSLSAASIAYVMGFPLPGALLGGIVAALALLAATTGFCAGCWMYKLVAPLFGITIRHIDPAEFCAECASLPRKAG